MALSGVCPAPEFVLAHARSLQAEKLRGDLSGTVCASPPGPKGSTSRISTPLMPGGPGTGSAPVRLPAGSSILPVRSYCSRSPPATSTPSNDLHSRLRTGPGSAEAGQRRRREQGRGSCALSTRRTGSQTARCLMPLVPADCDDDRGHTTGDEECEQCENGHGDDIDNRGRGNSACDSRAGAHIASLLPGHGNSAGPDLESRPAVLYADSCPRPSVFTGTHISPPRAAVCRCERRLARVASAGVQWMTVPVIRLRCSCENPDVQAFRATCAGRFFRV